MTKIINIKDAKKQPDQSVIAILEDILAKAKQGELIEFQLVGRCSDGDIVTASAGEKNEVFLMFGALSNAALDYRSEHIERFNDV